MHYYIVLLTLELGHGNGKLTRRRNKESCLVHFYMLSRRCIPAVCLQLGLYDQHEHVLSFFIIVLFICVNVTGTNLKGNF